MKTRAAETRTEKWDEEISSLIIYIVDPATNKLPPHPNTRNDILRRIDRTTHRLVQVGTAPGPADAFGPSGAAEIPVCKVVSKKDAYLDAERKKAEAKEKKRVSNITSSVKTLELNWAIDSNDLGHRLEKLRGFLEEGRKVEVVLASKKRGRKASGQECEEVVGKIRGTVDGVEGAREDKGLKGELGKFCSMAFVGRAPKVGKMREGVGEDG